MIGCHTAKKPVLFHLEGEAEPSWDALAALYEDERGVYVFYKRAITHDLKPDVTSNAPRWYFFESVHWKEVVLEDDVAGDDTGVQIAVAPGETVRFFEARLTTPGGEVLTYDRSDLQSHRVAGDSMHFELAVDSLSKETTLEVAYEIERKDVMEQPPMSHDVPLQVDKPVRAFEFAYTYPRHWSIQVKQVGPDRSVEVIETEDRRAETKTLTYRSANVPAFYAEMYGPFFKEVAPYFHVHVTHMEVGNVLERQAPVSWAAIAQRFDARATPLSRRDVERARAVLADLQIDDSMAPRDVVDRVLRHIDQDIEVVFSGKSDLWKKQRGNPEAVTEYADLLLNEAGLDTERLIVHSAREGYFDEAFVSEEQFVVPALRLAGFEAPLYIFPSQPGIPAGFIPREFEGQPALAYANELNNPFTRIPAASETDYRDEGVYTVYVNADGEVRAEAAVTLGAHSTYRFNKTLISAQKSAQKSTQEQELAQNGEARLIRRLLAHDSMHISNLRYEIEHGDREKPMTVRASYHLTDCLDATMQDVFIESCGLLEPINDDWYTFTAPRKGPFVLPEEVFVSTRVRVIHPQSWTLTRAIDARSESNSHIAFERTFRQGKGTFEVDQRVTLPEQPVETLQGQLLAEAPRLPQGADVSSVHLSTQPKTDAARVDIYEGGPWTVVASSYTSYEAAYRQARKIENEVARAEIPVRVMSFEGRPGEYQILVGMFMRRSEVEDAKILMGKQIPFDSWISELDPQMTAVLVGTQPVKY